MQLSTSNIKNSKFCSHQIYCNVEKYLFKNFQVNLSSDVGGVAFWRLFSFIFLAKTLSINQSLKFIGHFDRFLEVDPWKIEKKSKFQKLLHHFFASPQNLSPDQISDLYITAPTQFYVEICHFVFKMGFLLYFTLLSSPKWS